MLRFQRGRQYAWVPVVTAAAATFRRRVATAASTGGRACDDPPAPRGLVRENAQLKAQLERVREASEQLEQRLRALQGASQPCAIDVSTLKPLALPPIGVSKRVSRVVARLPFADGAMDPADKLIELVRTDWPKGPCLADKSDVLLTATAGSAGAGKTELLLHLAERLDTVRPSGTQHADQTRRRQADDGASVRRLDETHPFHGLADAFVVLFATFNQAANTHYQPKVDTEMTIEQRLVQRFAANYFDPAFLKANVSVDSWPQLTEFLPQVRRAAAAELGGGVAPERIGVLLCIDEIMKIENAATRSRLLEALASSRHEEFEAGLPTFVLVSSLLLWPVSKVWQDGSQREMAAVELPPLGGLDAVKARVPDHPAAKQAARKREEWEVTKDVVIDTTGGHPRDVQRAFQFLSTLAEQRGQMQVPPLDHSLADVAMLWRVAFAAQILGNTSAIGESEARALMASHPGASSCLRLSFDGPAATLRAALAKVRCPPRLFIASAVGQTPQEFPWLGDCVDVLWDTLSTTSRPALEKNWEAGIIAAAALRARALAERQRNLRDPNLAEVFPGAYFWGPDRPANWTVPITQCNTFHEEVSEADLLKPGDNDLTLLRVSRSQTQNAVEGALELRTSGGGPAWGLTQNKLWRAGTITADKVRSCVEKADAYYRGKRDATMRPMCVVLFAVGMSGAARSELKSKLKALTRRVNVVVVSETTCETLLTPLGANALLRKVKQSRRPARAPKKK